MMIENDNLFCRKFGITPGDLQRYLSEALSTGGDYADLYLEYRITSSITMDESMVKSASHGISTGCGVRVLVGNDTGYAHTEDLSPENIQRTARAAALIARGPAQHPVRNFKVTGTHQLYPVSSPSVDAEISAKLQLLMRADKTGRAYDSRIVQVRGGYTDELRYILIAGSDGTLATDVRPLARMSASCVAKSGSRSSQATSGGGGRVGIDYFLTENNPESFAGQAAREALIQLDAREAPVGEMEVVLGPGWPGILLHEAIGHGLEADLNRKGASAFSNSIGRRIASDKCTVVDNGTLPSRRGSLNVDDEGSPTQETVLIEKGILKGYLSDKLSSKLMRMPHTGNGRRQSYEHIPIPRMTNTYMLSGDDSPEDILRSVKHGVYAVNFGNGSVDITNGKFVFFASQAYLIENGKITAPLKNCTLIGDGPNALTKVSMVGNDLQLDEGVGTCGKESQKVPVGVGIPTLKLDSMTIGGTAR